MPKLTVEQIARPALALVMILIYWANNDAPSVGSTMHSVTRHYETPCYSQLREAHPEVPHGEDSPTAYMMWWNSTPVAERSAWSSAVRDCQTSFVAEHGKWSFDNMILVRTEGN